MTTIFVITSAIGTLDIPALTGFMNLVLSWLPDVIAASIIFVVATAVADAIGGLTPHHGRPPTGRVVRAAAPAPVTAIAIFTQLGIAPAIVTAADMVDSGYRKAQDQSDQLGQDMAVGRDRAQQEAQQVRERASPTARRRGRPSRMSARTGRRSGTSKSQTPGGWTALPNHRLTARRSARVLRGDHGVNRRETGCRDGWWS